MTVSLENWYVHPRLDDVRVALTLTERALSHYEDDIVESQQLYRRLAGVTEAHQFMAQAEGLAQARRQLAQRIRFVDDEHKRLSDVYEVQLVDLHQVAAEVLAGLFKVLGCGLLCSGLWTPGPCAFVSGVRDLGFGFLPGSQREGERERERERERVCV